MTPAPHETETAPAPPDRGLFAGDRRREYLALLSLWLMVFASSSQVMIMTPILPRIGEELAIPESLYGTLISGFAIALGALALIVGPISDRVGRRRVLLYGTGALTLILLLHVFAVNYPALLALRILGGAGAGLLSGAAVSYIGDAFPYERRGWANGWVMSGFAFGQLFAIPLGTLLAESHGFRAPFVAFAGPMALSFALVVVAAPQPDVPLDTTPLSIRDALRGYGELLRRPVIRGATATFLLLFMSMTTFFVYFPTWLETQHGAGAQDIAALFFVGGIASVLSGPAAGWASDRVGRRPLILSSCAGFFALALAVPVIVRSLATAYLVYTVAMVLYAMRLSPLQALLTALVDDQQRGRLLSLNVAVGQIGSAVGSAVAGPLFARYGYTSNTDLGALLVALAGAVVWRALPEPRA